MSKLKSHEIRNKGEIKNSLFLCLPKAYVGLDNTAGKVKQLILLQLYMSIQKTGFLVKMLSTTYILVSVISSLPFDNSV